MTPEQLTDLERIMGGRVRLRYWRDTVVRLDVLCPAIKDCDAVAVVLPPEMLPGLLRIAGNIPILWSVSSRVPTGRVVTLYDGRREAEFAYIHRGWEQILRAEFTTRKLYSPTSRHIIFPKQRNIPESDPVCVGYINERTEKPGDVPLSGCGASRKGAEANEHPSRKGGETMNMNSADIIRLVSSILSLVAATLDRTSGKSDDN